MSGADKADASEPRGYNQIYSVGRRRSGENGCTTDIYQLDHGIYASGSNIVVRRNVFFDTNRGYPIHFYGGVTTNLTIEHNTISGAAPPGVGGNAAGAPQGQIRLASMINGAVVRNNICHGVSATAHGCINAQPGTHTNVKVSYNITDGLMNVWGSSLNNVTHSNNVERSAALLLKNPESNDFTPTLASGAVDSGLDTGQGFCGT